MLNRSALACLLIIFTGAIIQPSAQTNPQPARQNPQQRRPARPAQPGQEKPFIEPAEMHKAAPRVLETQPAQRGRWDTLPELMPINPVHVALMYNSKVLVISGSGNDPNNKDFQAGVWDPASGSVRTFPIRWDMFCTPYPADIKSVVLIRPGAVTHAFDMEQRLVGLTFTLNNDQLYVKAPANGNIAPPGYYMVIILNSKGVPSKAAFVRLT